MNPEVSEFTSTALGTLTLLASLTASFFLILGAYRYITSSGKPQALEGAKKTIKNALIGLVLILTANTFVSVLYTAFTTPSIPATDSQLALVPIEPVTVENSLTQILIDAIGALLQIIIQSITKPITDAVINFLTTTPPLATNSVIFNFWLTMLGITDALFALVVAALGFQFMSASTFGFEEIELKQILPKVGLAFLGANTSIFVIDWVIKLNNTLISAVLNSTGGLNLAWIDNAFNPGDIDPVQTLFVTEIFMLMFLILAIVLLLFYITRLISIAVGAVLAPLIFLLWSLPKFADFAEISAKTYLTTIFSIFIHVVVIQLAAAFLTLPNQVGTNSLISILVGVGLLMTLLKTQSFVIQLMFYNSARGLTKKIGGQITNVISSRQDEPAQEVLTPDQKIALRERWHQHANHDYSSPSNHR